MLLEECVPEIEGLNAVGTSLKLLSEQVVHYGKLLVLDIVAVILSQDLSCEEHDNFIPLSSI